MDVLVGSWACSPQGAPPSLQPPWGHGFSDCRNQGLKWQSIDSIDLEISCSLYTHIMYVYMYTIYIIWLYNIYIWDIFSKMYIYIYTYEKDCNSFSCSFLNICLKVSASGLYGTPVKDRIFPTSHGTMNLDSEKGGDSEKLYVTCWFWTDGMEVDKLNECVDQTALVKFYEVFVCVEFVLSKKSPYIFEQMMSYCRVCLFLQNKKHHGFLPPDLSPLHLPDSPKKTQKNKKNKGGQKTMSCPSRSTCSDFTACPSTVTRPAAMEALDLTWWLPRS